MEDMVGLTLACLNLKKLVKRMAGEPFYFVQMRWFKHGNSHFYLKTLKKTNTKSMFVFNLFQRLFLYSERQLSYIAFLDEYTALFYNGFSVRGIKSSALYSLLLTSLSLYSMYHSLTKLASFPNDSHQQFRQWQYATRLLSKNLSRTQIVHSAAHQSLLSEILARHK